MATKKILNQILGCFKNILYLCGNYERKGHRAAYLAITKTYHYDEKVFTTNSMSAFEHGNYCGKDF